MTPIQTVEKLEALKAKDAQPHERLDELIDILREHIGASAVQASPPMSQIPSSSK